MIDGDGGCTRRGQLGPRVGARNCALAAHTADCLVKNIPPPAPAVRTYLGVH